MAAPLPHNIRETRCRKKNASAASVTRHRHRRDKAVTCVRINDRHTAFSSILFTSYSSHFRNLPFPLFRQASDWPTQPHAQRLDRQLSCAWTTCISVCAWKEIILNYRACACVFVCVCFFFLLKCFQKHPHVRVDNEATFTRRTLRFKRKTSALRHDSRIMF